MLPHTFLCFWGNFKKTSGSPFYISVIFCKREMNVNKSARIVKCKKRRQIDINLLLQLLSYATRIEANNITTNYKKENAFLLPCFLFQFKILVVVVVVAAAVVAF